MVKKNQPYALVTGALGHSGTYQIKRLIELGYKIVATDLKAPDRKKLMTKETIFRNDLTYLNIEHPDVNFIPADLTDKDSLYALWKEDQQYDVVFHPASLYDYFAPLDLLLKINVKGTKNLLEVIYERQTDNLPRFIHWSTAGVYGEPEYKVKKDAKGKKVLLQADETAPYNPPNYYSTSKMFQEFVVFDFYKNKNVPITILRPIIIAGPHQLYGAYHIFILVYKTGKMLLPVVFPRLKQNHINMCHVEDLANAAVFCYEHEETIGEAYNVGSESCTQWEFLDYLFSISDSETMVIPMWNKIYNFIAKMLLLWFQREMTKARKWGIRSWIDQSMVEYVTHNYYFSNQKLIKLGFKYKYPTVFDVAKDSVRWYLDYKWFEIEGVK